MARVFSDTYREQCFQDWFLNGKPSAPTKVLEVIQGDEEGRKPNLSTIAKWREELGWDLRADELDARVSLKTDDLLIAQKVLMLKEHAARGRELSTMGMEKLREIGFDTSSAAVQAIIKGAELERDSRGLSEALLKISKMNEKQLMESIMEKIEKIGDGNTVLSGGDEVEVTDVKEE
jgi:hypothetical protein